MVEPMERVGPVEMPPAPGGMLVVLVGLVVGFDSRGGVAAGEMHAATMTLLLLHIIKRRRKMLLLLSKIVHVELVFAEV